MRLLTNVARYSTVSSILKNTKMSSEGGSWKTAATVYEFTANNIEGEPVSLEKYNFLIGTYFLEARRCNLRSAELHDIKEHYDTLQQLKTYANKKWRIERGHVLLIVNVATKCGLTPKNYAQLAELDEKYREQGLRILAFPCNQFAGQEPGTADQICTFAKKQNVNFDIFDKVDVNGDNAHPLWNFLKMKQPGTFGNLIKWNFTKFLVNKEGKPVERFAPTTEPFSMIGKIEALLK